MLYNALSLGKKTPKLPRPLEFRHPAGGGPSRGHRQHSQKMVKIERAVPEISSRTDRQTHTDILITILRNRSRARSYNGLPIHKVKLRHSNLWSPRYDLHVVGHDVVCAKLTGEDLLRYLNKIQSIGLRKA